MAAVIGVNVPNYQGMFLRGYGSQIHTKNNGSTVGNTATNHASGNLGTVQGDAIRNISGVFWYQLSNDSLITFAIGSDGSGVFTTYSTSTSTGYVNKSVLGTYSHNWGNILNASRVVPTTVENRPVNVAVKYIIYAKE